MNTSPTGVPCPLCGQGLRIKLARSKKGKPSIARHAPWTGDTSEAS